MAKKLMLGGSESLSVMVGHGPFADEARQRIADPLQLAFSGQLEPVSSGKIDQPSIRVAIIEAVGQEVERLSPFSFSCPLVPDWVSEESTLFGALAEEGAVFEARVEELLETSIEWSLARCLRERYELRLS